MQEDAEGVDFFEVISENFFEAGGRPWAVLDRVRRDRPVVLHGVSMGLGNLGGVPTDYLRKLRTLMDRVEPMWVSDHLCWGGYGGHHAHDLLPLPYTEEAVRHVAAKVGQVQEALGQQILIENVSSYVAFRDSTLSEAEFVTAVAEEADCGILLDVNNVIVSAFNHSFSAEGFVDEIPAARVGQIHVAGHSDHGDYLFDSHVGPVPANVWALYERAIARCGSVATIVEWDTDVPHFREVVAETALSRVAEARALGAASAPSLAGVA